MKTQPTGNKELTFIHEDGVVCIEEEPNLVIMAWVLDVDYKKDPRTQMTLCRFPAFPAQIGSGESPNQAIEELKKVFHTFLEVFLAQNSIEGFKSKLISNGFEPTKRTPIADDLDEWRYEESFKLTFQLPS